MAEGNWAIGPHRQSAAEPLLQSPGARGQDYFFSFLEKMEAGSQPSAKPRWLQILVDGNIHAPRIGQRVEMSLGEPAQMVRSPQMPIPA